MEMTTEHMVLAISKDVEQLSSAMVENAKLFRENQAAVALLISEMREHKALDDVMRHDVYKLHDQVYGTPSELGMVTKVHDMTGKMHSLWKLVWTALGAGVTAAVGLLFSKLG